MKRFCCLFVVCFMVFVSADCLADTSVDSYKEIDTDHLQARANELVESDPDAKQATVSVEIKPVEDETMLQRRTISFDHLDLNQDGVLERSEVGEALFQVFDRDGNHVIDNHEMKVPSLIVYAHMDREMVEMVDYHSESRPTKKNISHQEFLRESQLSRFDKNKDGLSPLDFLEMTFLRVNVIDDAVIDLYEWKRAYAESVRPKHMESYNYND